MAIVKSREKTNNKDIEVAKAIVVIIKPDGMLRGLSKDIKARLTTSGFEIIASSRRLLRKEDVAFVYHEHVDKPYWKNFVKFMTSKPVEIMLVIGDDGSERLWRLVGHEMGQPPIGTIRGDYYTSKKVFPNLTGIYENIIHSSDKKNSKREVEYFGRMLRMNLK